MKDLQEMVFTIQLEDVGRCAVSVGDAKELLEELKAVKRELAGALDGDDEEPER